MTARISAQPMLIRTARGQSGLLLAWAVLSGLVYPPVNAWPLAHLALLPLVLLAIRGAGRWKLLGLTYLVASVWWAVMLRWLNPVTAVGGVPLGTLVLAMYLGLYPVAFVAVLRVVHRWLFRPPLVVTVPLVWVGLEYLRGNVLLNGFPWHLLGQSQPLTLIQIADVTGTYGVSFLVAMTSGLLADLLTRPLVRREGTSVRWGRSVRFATLLWGLLFATAVGYGLWRRSEAASGPTLRVGVVQTNVPQSQKNHPDDKQDWQNFKRALTLSRRLVERESPDLVVWPETMVPRPLNRESVRLFRKLRGSDRLAVYQRYAVYRDRLEAFAENHGVSLVVGAHAQTGWRRKEPDGALAPAKRFNSAYLVTPEEGVSQRYDKILRVPFGEYVPLVGGWPTLKRLFIRYLTPYDHDYSLTPGTDPTPLSLRVRGRRWRIGTPICFEDVINTVARRMVYTPAGKRADLLVNLSNDGWFAGTVEPYQHHQIARFRAVENRVPLVRTVNTGVSGLIGPSGAFLGRVREDGRATGVASFAAYDVAADSRSTLFGRFGNALPIASAIGTALLLLLAFLARQLTELGRRGRR